MLKGCLLAGAIMLAYPIGLVVYFAATNLALVALIIVSLAIVIVGYKKRRKS